MKKTLLSLVTISAIATTGVLADSATDIAELKAMMQQMNKRLAKLETENKQLRAQVAKKKHTVAHKKTPSHKKHYALTPAKKDRVEALEEKVQKLEKQTPVFAKTSKLKFSGTHYLGFVSDKYGASDGGRINKFETRRNYLQVKGYFFDDPKSYMRVTLDTFQNKKDDGKDSGSWEVRLKYAYLYLNNVLPNTGVEIGQAHRPWIDYEEHHGWLYRSISKTFIEGTPDLVNSSDIGLNFKTKTDYFSSELGVYNGSGYHGVKDGEGLSGEWRLTGHILGTGKKHVHKHDTFADVSFFGQYGTDGIKNSDANGDYVWYGVHAVYNQPAFLLAAQYIKADKAKDSKKGDGWSVNGEFRPIDKVSIFAKYDDYTLDNDIEKKSTIVGLGYQYSKYVELIANYIKNETDDQTVKDAIMLTAEVNW